MTEALHQLARELAVELPDPDKKQLRFNEIVECAEVFYNDPAEGVAELVEACDRKSPAYVNGHPMHRTLQSSYRWLIDPARSETDRKAA